ncbi:hypothetical protein Q3G72_008694 [Acer saccharum]|nr:hypothetical protein Q3G72_008694 [Acer saccharum]
MDDCANISSAISGNLLQHLNSLEKLHVRNGDSLEEVFDLEELNADGDLKIEGTNQRFPNLDELQLSGKAMAMAMRWPSQVPGHDFRSLKSLELNDHESTVVPIDFIKRFGNLEKLSLNSSSYNKEIFSYGKDKEHPEIKHLVLSGLFDLKQIWKQGSKVDPNFQNLRILELTTFTTYSCRKLVAHHLHKSQLLGKTGKDISATPSIFNGTLYFPSSNGISYAIKASVGSLVWKKNVHNLTGLTPKPGLVANVNWTVSRATPTIIVDDDHDLLIIGVYGPAYYHVYIATGNLYSVPPHKEECQEREYNQTVPTHSDECVEPDNHLNSILALDLDSGKIKWYHQLGGFDLWFFACNNLSTPGCPPGPIPDVDFGVGTNDA